MKTRDISRRDFMGAAALAAGVQAPERKSRTAAPKLDTSKILNYNPAMEYRRLGKTNLMVSAVCLGGHWKRVGTMIRPGFQGAGYMEPQDFKNLSDAAFIKNRTDVVNHCMKVGINYVDACSPQEILAYSKVLKGRREKMYLGFSWHVREPRFEEWRNADRLLQGYEMSLKEAGLTYADVWRISLPMEGISDLGTLKQVEDATVGALEKAKRQGKARFIGVSTHNRVWLASIIREYPKQIEVALFPYTAATTELPNDSVFDAIKEHDTGVFGIKPFADNSLFVGDSSLGSPHAEEDSKRARLALRYILQNPAITAPIPGMINVQQVNNAVQAVAEFKKTGRLSRKERAELDRATDGIWARLRPGHEWLRDWECV